MSAKKLVYSFGAGKTEGSDKMRSLLGGKGASLAEMSRFGLRVPPGFTVTTEACRTYSAKRASLFNAVPGLKPQFDRALKRLEKVARRRLGDAQNPLLLAVRSGATVSMPGMLDTVLNLGLSRACVDGLARQTNDRRFALDSRRRFISMFGSVARGIEKDAFERALGETVRSSGKSSERELDASALEMVCETFLEIYRNKTREDFPEDPRVQLELAVEAVFKSWNNPRAMIYRKANRIPDDLGTACSVQAMVFGNRPGSGTGVGFTRNPATGAKEFYGEYLPEAQGEDVVAGIRTPMPLARLKEEQPKIYGELRRVTQRLERHYRDVQDFEFTVEERRLYMLQTREGKRTAAAALRIAVDMVREGLISRKEAVLRVSPGQLDHLLKPLFDDKARKKHRVLARGLPAGPGAAAGRIVFSADEAVSEARSGPVILVRNETNPDDIHGMMAAEGILTATGGLTSHAAVVGRGMGKVCVVGCQALRVRDRSLEVNGTVLRPGEFLSINGFNGEVLLGQVPTQPSEILQVLQRRRALKSSSLFGYYKTFMEWADGFRRLGIWANADLPEDARIARLLGAEGVGLCRTEHMFFGEKRISRMLAMILAETPEERQRALTDLFPMQKEDFKGILKAMGGLPVIFRTLDPPLHEFLPHDRAEAERRGLASGQDAHKLWLASQRLREANPMLGHRGCRLGITLPEITQMQAKAILSAAKELAAKGQRSRPEIMIPLVGFASELRDQKAVVNKAAAEVLKGARLSYSVGAMLEVPRAVWTAAEIAQEAGFFSFGTNDLTQMVLGYSRDDYGKFLPAYLAKKIMSADPFQTLDQTGVGAAVAHAVREARKAKPGIKIGVCGEHGGDPESIGFFHRADLDYVSCSPYRVPVARLAAAQAALSHHREVP